MMHVPTVYQRINGMGYAFRGMGDDSDGDPGDSGSGSGETGTEGSGTPGTTDNSSGETNATCYAFGSNGSCLSYTTDGGATTVGCGMSTSGVCGTTGPPSTISANSGSACVANGGIWANNTCTAGATGGGPVAGQQAYNNPTTCAAAGGTWNGATCGNIAPGTTPGIPPTGSALTNFLNSLESNTPTILRAITGQTVTAAQCAAAGGTMSATGVCSPGISSYLPLLLIAGVGIMAIAMMSGKGR